MMNIQKFFVLFLQLFYKSKIHFTKKYIYIKKNVIVREYRSLIPKECRLRHNTNLTLGSLNKPKGAKRHPTLDFFKSNC